MEGGRFDPRLSTATKLADALRVRVEWLLTGDNGMVGLRHMTRDEQHREQSGTGSEGLPGYVVIAPGGTGYRDRRGRWCIRGSPDYGAPGFGACTFDGTS